MTTDQASKYMPSTRVPRSPPCASTSGVAANGGVCPISVRPRRHGHCTRRWQRRTGGTLAAAAIAGVILIAVGGVAYPAAAWAACATLPPRELAANASVILVAQALDGPAAAGRLLTPARFRVLRYIKGTGPPVVQVETELARRTGSGGATSAASEEISPRPGDVWKIYAQRSPNGILTTSICAGSEKLGERALPATDQSRSPPASSRPAADSSASPWALVAALAVVLLAAVAILFRTRRPGHSVSQRDG